MGTGRSMTLGTANDVCPPIGPEFLSVRLEDGSCLQIRLVTPADRAHLVDGFARLSKQSRYTRFFSYIPSLEGPVLDNLADLSGHLHVALGAFAGNDELGHGVAVARAIQPASGEPAELAITVVDGAQGLGLGELLLHILVVMGTKLGVTSFTATTLRENHPAGKAFRKIGAKTAPDPEDMAISLATMVSGDLKKLTGWPPELEEEIQRFATRAGQAVQQNRLFTSRQPTNRRTTSYRNSQRHHPMISLMLIQSQAWSRYFATTPGRGLTGTLSQVNTD
jgi:hypothetical protein